MDNIHSKRKLGRATRTAAMLGLMAAMCFGGAVFVAYLLGSATYLDPRPSQEVLAAAIVAAFAAAAAVPGALAWRKGAAAPRHVLCVVCLAALSALAAVGLALGMGML